MHRMTRREIEVIPYLIEGHCDKFIANKLGISIRTAEHHMGNILAKLGARNRTQAAVLADRQMRLETRCE